MQIVQQAQGSKVLAIQVPKGNYRVTWETQGGPDNFIVHFLGPNGATVGLVNQIAPNPPSGQFLFPSPGGTFNFEIKASTLTWKLTFLQILWPTSAGSYSQPITLSGHNATITDPLYLPSGNYKIAWTSQGAEGNFIVHLFWGDSGERGLINEIPPNPSSGEAAFDSGGGWHLLEVAAANQDWTITITKP